MTVAASLALWLLAAAPAEQAAPTQSQENRIYEVRDQIARAAFDPSTYYAKEEYAFDLIHITYRGDDRGWPFYTIAIRSHCDKTPAGECQKMRTARMVRVPVEADERPRRSGNRLVSEVMQKAASAQDIPKALDAAGLQWVEADLATCPGAMPVLAEALQTKWVLKSMVAPAAGEEFSITLHADTVTVTFKELINQASYTGALFEGTPAAWGHKLAKTLEPCWKPANATPPWRQ